MAPMYCALLKMACRLMSAEAECETPGSGISSKRMLTLTYGAVYKFILLGRPERQFRKALCFTRDVFFFFRRATSELPRLIAVKLCHMIAISVNFIMQVQKFGGPPPKEIGGQKQAKFGAISDIFRFRSRISPERVEISKIGKTSDHQRILPRSTKKVR